MKTKLIKLIALAFMCSSDMFGQCSDFITVDGQKLKCGSNDFFALVANYLVDVTRGPSSNDNNYVYPNYYPSRGHGYFYVNTFNPNVKNNATADSLMRRDFRAIKAKGFNTVRIYGCGYSDTTTTTDWNGNNIIKIAYSNALYTQLVLDIAGGVLRSAKAAGLKVIFGTGGNPLGKDDAADAAYQAGYIDYLQKFGQRFGNDPALLAVDFLNEPTPTSMAYWAKNHACRKVKEWNDALKLHSNALSTIGLMDVGTTFFWDPNLLNVDFISFHPYPYTNINGVTSLTDGINRVKSDYWWYKNNVKLPWIIGETGLSAHPANTNSVNTFYDNGHSAGTLQDQTTYLHETLNAARDYGGAGYSWWEYSDQAPGNYTGGPNKGPFWGLVYANDGLAPIVWKPAAQEIANFNPNGTGTAVQPPNYYNYFNTPIVPGDYVVGTVYDAETSSPIKDALIELVDSVPGIKGKNFHSTYTFSNGGYLIPRTPSSIIQYLIITATECNVLYRWNNFFVFGGIAHSLNKLTRPTTNTLTFAYDIVSNGNVSAYALVNADFTNYQLLSSNFKITAGSYINLKQGFAATSNSNFNAHIGPYYQDCGSFAFRKNTDETSTSSENTNLASKKMLPEERTEERFFQTRIFPNPGAGVYNIDIEKEGTYEVTVSTMYGAVIKTYSFKGNQGTVLLEHESPGLYLFSIKDQDNQIQNFKVVKE